MDGRDDPATWDKVGDAWAALEVPYETARARWRAAEARLNSGAGRAGRADARVPLLEAVGIALELARSTGATLPVSALAAQLESGLVARGYGDEDMSNLARAIRSLSGMEG